ncbi:MAG: ECF transporter S component [Lachnospiraceae bacterium]|nr:ECF transporter S component [Lachnospiraceae bacterium]
MNTNNTSKTFNTSQLVILGLMTAILLLMAYTPLGYLNIGPLAITFNVIPVAIAAITLGPVGGAVTGSVFGLTSFLQCIGIGGTSAMGAILFGINPFLAFVQRFVPRFLDGLLLGYIFRGVRKVTNTSFACLLTGFCSAFLNTLFFMSALVLLFGNTEYMQGLIGGRNILVFICGFVGVNAVCEMVSSTILTGAVGIALYKAHFVPAPSRTAKTENCAH